MGMIQLFNGDCLEVMQDMPNNSVDYVLTSPPYNRKRNDKYKLYNDQITDYFTFNKKVINKLLGITKKHIFYNIQTNFYNRDTVYKLIGYFNKDIKEIIIWEKSNPMPASGYSITNAVEYFIVLGKESLKSNTTYTKNIITSSVNSKMPKIHKAVMKQEIADYFIKKFTKEKDIILDPFMGIGTTGISCVSTNRDFIGIELIKEYYDISKHRIQETSKS
jgi:site-specific DNA-methyltransferase (adenine-specific)